MRRYHVVTVPVHNIYIGSVNLGNSLHIPARTLRGYIWEITQTGFGLGLFVETKLIRIAGTGMLGRISFRISLLGRTLAPENDI